MKVLYSLGCTCDPHVSWQTSLKEHVAPSIFAGLIQLQEESETFIPKFLFDGTLEKFFFIKEKWQRLDRYDNNVFRNSDDSLFQYSFNLQHRKILDKNKQNSSKAKALNPEIYYNDELHLLNIHAKDKTPGVNPMFVDYQRKKYEFFLEHKRELKFGIYLHRSVTEQQLADFQDLVLNEQNLDPKNFVLFIRNGKETFQNIKFQKVFLKYGDNEQSNPFYSSQRKSMVEFAKNYFLS